ncbi:MAG: hypothetical protein ABR523_00105, partial [Desulfurivibrionaceae bacterium]
IEIRCGFLTISLDFAKLFLTLLIVFIQHRPRQFNNAAHGKFPDKICCQTRQQDTAKPGNIKTQ